MSPTKNYIKLFSCCIPVKGRSRSTICDLQRNDIKLIPNALYDLMLYFNKFNKDQIISHYTNDNKDTIQEYLDFLISNDLAFYCSEDELKNFPLIDFSEFHLPYQISNAIIEVEDIDKAKTQKIINELNSVNCLAIEIRIQKKICFLDLENFLAEFNNPAVNINEVNVIVPDNKFAFENLKHLFEQNPRLTNLIISNSLDDSSYADFSFRNSNLIFTTRNVHLPTCCGNFEPYAFTTNITFFNESQKHNTCLNRKVAIDKDGNIKNCPSMEKTFGNIKDVALLDIIENKKFTEKWHINKDQIKICQDCEFRHVCMDCRAYLEDPYDDRSKPLKCGYNPYTMEWDEWSENPLKAKAIAFYNPSSP